MKTLKFIVLFLMMSMIASCSDKDDIGITPKAIDEKTEQEEIVLNWVDPVRVHLLWLSFQDTSGNNLLKNIGYDVWKDGGYVTPTAEEPGSGRVKPELYTLEYIYPDGIPNPWKPEPAPLINVDGVSIPAYILHERSPEIRFYRDLEQQLPADTYFYFRTGSSKDSLFPETITFKLTCPYLFGDNEPHDIVTWWKPVATFQTSCYRVEFNGKEYKTSYFNEDIRDVATIILDK